MEGLRLFKAGQYHLLLVLSSILLLSACETTTTAKTAAPADAATQMFSLGTYVGYSEICTQFRGSGTDNRIIQDIKDRFGNNADFERGYDRYKSYSVYDRIDRLSQCDEVHEGLIKFHKELTEARGTKT